MARKPTGKSIKQPLEAYLNNGRSFREICQFQLAIKNFQQALTLAEEMKDEKQVTKANIELGHAYRLNNQIQTAIQHCEKALEIAKERGYKQEKTKAYLGLGKAYRLNNHIQTAMEHYEKALGIAIERGYKKEETKAHIGLGDAYRLSNQIQTAILHCEKALGIAIERGYKKEETKAHLGLGKAYKLSNQIQTAIQHCEKALGIAIERGYKKEETKAHDGLGDAYRLNNQIQMAIQHHEKALAIAREQGYKDLARKVIEELSRLKESPESWKWEESSIIHREKFVKLLQYKKDYPEEIKDVNGVLVCCSEEFLIGKGNDGTRVYVGLGKDGYERAVKRLPRDACAGLAEQEKRVLNQLNTIKSKYVVRYWFLEEQSDKHHLFLILDLCEETLENFVARNSVGDLVTIAPGIIQQVLKGLADLHRDPLPILHRDLKPTNILRNVHDEWLLADFGISRILTGGASIHPSNQRGTEDWKAVESSYPSNDMTDDGKVRYKKESDIQVAGIVAFYIVTKGEHPFGEKPDRLRNLLDGKPVALETWKDPILKDLLSWMLSHDPKDRPSADEALKHPYLQPKKLQFEMLCKVGNEQEIKTRDVKSDVVRKLNSHPKGWRSLVRADVLKYLSTDSLTGKTFHYKPPWTDCLRLIRNVKEHWHDRRRPRPEVFYLVGDPQEYFLKLFPNLSVEVHRIVRSCDWKERPDLKEYFI